MPPRPNATPSLAQSTHDRVRADIIAGALAPASRLRLDDLRARYGASVPTLREVLNRLASEGLVVAEDNRGFAVAPMSEANLRDLAGLRKLIEMDALARSFAAGDTDWEADVVGAHHRLSRIEERLIAGQPADRTDWKRMDAGFHRALIKGCGSAEMLALHGRVFDKYLRYQMVYLTFRGRIAADEHRALMEAALARDVARAQAVLVRHIDGGVAHALAAQRLAPR